MILPGAASQSLSAALADITGDDLGVVDRNRFADGEFAVQIPAPGSRAIVVGATVSPEAHIELLQLQDAAREAGADTVVTVLPYMGYARQDEAFRPGEPVSARAMAHAIGSATDRVVVVNPHEPSVTEEFPVPATGIDASPQLADGLPSDLSEPLFLAPDESATDLAAGVLEGYGEGDVDHLVKHRDRDTGEVSIRGASDSVADRDVVVVDDMVATGGTVSEAVTALEGANRVLVACVHGLFAGSARSRLAAAGVERVIATDTVEGPESQVSVAPAVAAALSD